MAVGQPQGTVRVERRRHMGRTHVEHAIIAVAVGHELCPAVMLSTDVRMYQIYSFCSAPEEVSYTANSAAREISLFILIVLESLFFYALRWVGL